MNERDFVKLVADMRSLQKKYFRERTSSLLARCKALEKEVDRYLEQFDFYFI